MQYDEFIEKVKSRARLKDNEGAVHITKAVLGTLGELVYRTEERQLAAQLPKELKEVFYQFQPPEPGRGGVADLTLDEFYNRVKARAGVSYQEAMRQSKIVIQVLQEAVTEGEIQDILAELPEEFHADLFQGDPAVRKR